MGGKEKVALGVFFPSVWDLMDCALCTRSQMLDQGGGEAAPKGLVY